MGNSQPLSPPALKVSVAQLLGQKIAWTTFPVSFAD
jgi:hypothetical protein